MAKVFYAFVLMVLASSVKAQTDKAEADQIIYEMLGSGTQTENWHPELIILSSQIEETAEMGIYIVRGDSFQIKTLRSDFYIYKKDDVWTPINDRRYPMESMVNILLNRINDNQHFLEIRHHQYGGKTPRISIPMQNLFDLLARNTELYCSVTFIDKHEIRAILVFHQQKMNFIHMLELRIDTRKLFDAQSTFYGDFYTNIPQNNIKDIFREKNK